ncbi:MAG TPA: Asp23/Gls24 family envelope stress response protein [Bacillota bacterium]
MAKQMETTTKRDLGSINISPDAIAMVAGIATLQCFGVVGMASRTIQDGISELLTGKDNLTKGIEVIIDDEQVVIDLYVIVEYGVQIKEVANNVIQTVKYAIQNQFSLDVAKVNVIVQGVRIEKNKN